MGEIVAQVTDMLAKVHDITAGMTGIFAALVALALLGIIFSRIGK